jgi:hypothetical protein
MTTKVAKAATDPRLAILATLPHILALLIPFLS